MTGLSNIRTGFLITLIIALFFAYSVSGTAQPEKEKNGSKIHTGKLLQMFKSGGYTYLEYESNGEKLWVASRTVVANVGNIIEFRNPLEMRGFYSKSLKRKFDLIFFAGMVRAVGKEGPSQMSSIQSMMGNKKMGMDKKVIVVKPGSVKKADKGVTIFECFDNTKNLKGKEISIRAIVVKVSMKIKGSNWVHIRDGSGQEGSNDITFTTKKIVSPGDLIIVKGKLVLNKDIGSGYIFPLFMEDPEITLEKE